MPNRPAKNINSLDSQTITPTLTMLGRLSVWIRELMAGAPDRPVAVVTTRLWTAGGPAVRAGLRKSAPISVPVHICAGHSAKDLRHIVKIGCQRRAVDGPPLAI